ncbi:MAG: DUF998 domain-containing protein [Candidatus Lokiarchaeota archaeon]|nr:DUF998 domain-containing protein [Candidatus Lokiarchaeota archaeon]
MKFKDGLMRKKNIGYLCGIIGITQFVFLTIIAMVIYPGGYSFWNNYFSHLGTFTSLINGESSIGSYIIWIITCSITSICLIPFWLTLRNNFLKSMIEHKISKIGTILGIASLPFLALIALFPIEFKNMTPSSPFYNLFFIFEILHLLSMYVFFILFATAIIMYSIDFFINKDYNPILGIYGVIVAIIIIIEIVFPVQLGATFQKVTVYSSISFVVVCSLYFPIRTMNLNVN